MASESTSTGGLIEFSMFPKLPKELRLMIWKKALPGLRLLEIKYHHGNYEDDGPVMQVYFDSYCPLPIFFTACKKLHSEFHHQYSISFPRMMHGPRLYFRSVGWYNRHRKAYNSDNSDNSELRWPRRGGPTYLSGWWCLQWDRKHLFYFIQPAHCTAVLGRCRDFWRLSVSEDCNHCNRAGCKRNRRIRVECNTAGI